MALSSLIHQKPYEHINLQIRRHYITFVPYLFIFLLLLLMPAGLYFLFANIFPTLLESAVALPLLMLSASVYYLSVTLFIYSYFVTFYLDLVIITNDSMVDIEQSSLFARTIAEVDLYKIQDATSEVKGFLPSLFNYGNIIIQTAGTVPRFAIPNAPNPHQLRQRILDLAAEDKKFHSK